MTLKQLKNFGHKYLIYIGILVVVLFIAFFASFRVIFSEPTYIYAKVKVGQGLWWASTQRPGVWYMNSINKGDISYGLMNKIAAEILSKRHYRYYGSDQYDIYLTIKLAAKYNKKRDEYTFDRSVLSIGSPVEFQFTKEKVTGTVIDLSTKPFTEKLVEKTIHMSKRGAYPWELSAINIGDKYFDGEDTIFEVVDKTGLDLTNLTWDTYGNSTANITEPTKYITVKAKVKLKAVNGQWILGEDQLVTPGRNISISTPNFIFENFIVSRLE